MIRDSEGRRSSGNHWGTRYGLLYKHVLAEVCYELIMERGGLEASGVLRAGVAAIGGTGQGSELRRRFLARHEPRGYFEVYNAREDTFVEYESDEQFFDAVGANRAYHFFHGKRPSAARKTYGLFEWPGSRDPFGIEPAERFVLSETA